MNAEVGRGRDTPLGEGLKDHGCVQARHARSSVPVYQKRMAVRLRLACGVEVYNVRCKVLRSLCDGLRDDPKKGVSGLCCRELGVSDMKVINTSCAEHAGQKVNMKDKTWKMSTLG